MCANLGMNKLISYFFEEYENYSPSRRRDQGRKLGAKIESYLISLKNKLQEPWNIKYKSILFFNTRNNLMNSKIDSEYGFLGKDPVGIDCKIDALELIR